MVYASNIAQGRQSGPPPPGVIDIPYANVRWISQSRPWVWRQEKPSRLALAKKVSMTAAVMIYAAKRLRCFILGGMDFVSLREA